MILTIPKQLWPSFVHLADGRDDRTVLLDPSATRGDLAMTCRYVCADKARNATDPTAGPRLGSPADPHIVGLSQYGQGWWSSNLAGLFV